MADVPPESSVLLRWNKLLRRSAKKKRKKSKRFESESESTSAEGSSSEEEEDKPKSPAVMPAVERRVIPGALAKPPEHPPWFKQILMKEERPELTAKFGGTALASEEVELLDNFMRCREEFLPGDLVITDDNLDEDSRDYSRYEVLTKYNEGRYSALYIVAKQTCSDNEETLDRSLYAMKVGLRKESVNTILRFKRELNVLRELRNAGVFHTPCLYDSGRVCDRYYIVMTLFDRNLEKLKECTVGNLRPSTVYHLAGEALEAIEEVHAVGYVHRDIKPTNFCIGLYAASARLYLVDFGEAVKNGKVIRYGIPDAFSLPYWAIDSHKKAAANSRVDLEAWFYTFAELQCPKLLVWKQCHVESDVLAAKTKFWTDLNSSLADCSLQFIEAAKIIANTQDKADFKELKRLMEEGKTANLKGAPLTLEWVKVMPKELPKRAKPTAAPDPNRSISIRSSKSKRTVAASPKRKQLAESDKSSQNAEVWSLSSNLMQKLRLRPKKGRKLFPFARASTADSNSSESTSGVSKSEKAGSEAKVADEPRETLFQRLSFRKKRKPKEAAEAQQSRDIERSSEHPSRNATASDTSSKENAWPQSKAEPTNKPETAISLIQRFSLCGKNKSDDRNDAKSKKALGKEGKGIIDSDAGGQITPQPLPSKKEETFFQMISLRLKKKKRSVSSSNSTEISSNNSGSAISSTSQASEDGTKSSADNQQELSIAVPDGIPCSKQTTSIKGVKSLAEAVIKKEEDLSTSPSANTTSVSKIASSEHKKTADKIAPSKTLNEKPISPTTVTLKGSKEKMTTDPTTNSNGSKEKLSVTAAPKGSEEKSKADTTTTAKGSEEKAPHHVAEPFINGREKSQIRGLLRRYCSLKKKATNSERELKNASSIRGVASETKKRDEVNKDIETRSISERMKRKAKGIWTKFMGKNT